MAFKFDPFGKDTIFNKNIMPALSSGFSAVRNAMSKFANPHPNAANLTAPPMLPEGVPAGSRVVPTISAPPPIFGSISENNKALFGGEAPTTSGGTYLTPGNKVIDVKTPVGGALGGNLTPGSSQPRAVPSTITPAQATSSIAADKISEAANNTGSFAPQPVPQTTTSPAPAAESPALPQIPPAPTAEQIAQATPQTSPTPSATAAPLTTGGTSSASGAGSSAGLPNAGNGGGGTDSSLKKYEDAVSEASKVSADELSTQDQLDKLQESFKKAYQNTSEQAIPLEFITGQQKAEENRALGLAEPLQTKLARLQAKRTASLEASKFALERVDKQNEFSAKNAPKPAEPFTLSPGEVRYDASGKQIASGGPKPISAAAEAKALENVDKATAAQQSATQSMSIINNLLSGDKYKNITGVGQNPLNIFGISNAAELVQYNQLQGLLKLGVRSLIKGQGAVSDYEGRILGDAASALTRGLPNEDFKQALLKIRGVMKTNNNIPVDVIVHFPDGTSQQSREPLTGQDIYDAVKDGNTIEYL